MTMCEYDREILRQVKTILVDISLTLRETLDLNKSTVREVIRTNNQMAAINKETLQYHLEALERATEGD